MRFRHRIIVMALAMSSMLIAPIPAWSDAQGELRQLNETEKAEFSDIVRSVDRWDGSEESFQKLSADMKQLLEKYPNLVPVTVESTRLKWDRIRRKMGIAHASRSFLPVYLELQKDAPGYWKSYLLAARSYIFTQDYEGALPSLKRATELSADDPWGDLTWSMLHDRKLEHDLAVETARKAIPNAGQSSLAMAAALLSITQNYGLTNAEDVETLAKQVYAAKRDRAFVASTISIALEGYSYQPGLIEVLAEIANLTAREFGTDPALLLAWSRLALVSEDLTSFSGSLPIDPNFGRPAEDILFSIRDESEVAQAVWSLRIDIALSKGLFNEAEHLIASGEKSGYPRRQVEQKNAALLNAQNKPREVVELYQKFGFPDDNLVMGAHARTGNANAAKNYYLNQIDESPTNAYTIGNYANFALYYLNDPMTAANYGLRAHTIAPYPFIKHTLALAYLTLAGQSLRGGQIEVGRHYYKQAAELNFDESYVTQSCYRMCTDVHAALTAFR